MDRDALRKLRKSMRLTQAQMAALIRMPVAAVKKLEAKPLAVPPRKTSR
jgi:transcriptional regulator with XRE-family HTH domain